MKDKVALVTGGDSGIGRAVSIAFAKEGSDLVIVYRNEHGDMTDTLRAIKSAGQRCITVAGDVGKMKVCRLAVRNALDQFGASTCL